MLHLHDQISGWISRPDIRKISLVFAVVGLVHQCVHAGVCQNVSWYPVCLSCKQVDCPYQSEGKTRQKKSRECHVLLYLHPCGAFSTRWGNGKVEKKRWHSFHSWLTSLSQSSVLGILRSPRPCARQEKSNSHLSVSPDSSNTHFFWKLSSYVRPLQTIKPGHLHPACGGNAFLPSFIPSVPSALSPSGGPRSVLGSEDQDEEWRVCIRFD